MTARSAASLTCRRHRATSFTSIAVHGDSFYLGNLGRFDPGTEGKAGVYRLHRRSWAIDSFNTGMTAVTGVAWHKRPPVRAGGLHRLLRAGAVRGRDGTIVRLGDDGKWAPVVTGLNFPTAMVFRGDDLYVSNRFGPADSQIVHIHLQGLIGI